ncbi:MAG: hypothetical protein FK733_02660 [Asgard group archaeon]|nr:hypothetical protein [Asgard group archaeon]
MKPVSLCLVQMGSKGLELVKAYPNVLPESVIDQIVIKSMPFNAKNGDFSSSTLDNTVFSGFVFSVPSQVGRDNIASLVAVYNDMKYDTETIRKVFSFTISELKKYNVADIETVSKILPNLYNGLAEGQLKIKISSIVTLEFDFKQKEEKDSDEDSINSFGKDLWR